MLPGEHLVARARLQQPPTHEGFEHPAAHPLLHLQESRLAQVGGDLHHAPGVTRRAGPACLAREGDQEVLTAVLAARPRKTSGQDSAIAAERTFSRPSCNVCFGSSAEHQRQPPLRCRLSGQRPESARDRRSWRNPLTSALRNMTLHYQSLLRWPISSVLTLFRWFLSVHTDCLDNLRPCWRGKLVAHALDDLELGIGYCLRRLDAAGKRYQRIGSFSPLGFWVESLGSDQVAANGSGGAGRLLRCWRITSARQVQGKAARFRQVSMTCRVWVPKRSVSASKLSSRPWALRMRWAGQRSRWSTSR